MAGESDPDLSEYWIDWDTVEFQGRVVSVRSLVFVVLMGLIGVGVAQQYLLTREDTGLFLGVMWRPSPVDWLFIVTLVIIGLYLVVPLVTNRRLSAYYWRQFKRNKAAVLSAIFLFGIFVTGIVVPMFLISPPRVEPLLAYQPPVYLSVDAATPVDCVGSIRNGRCYGTWEHPLGTTHQGKDILVMMIYGMQISMKVGLISTLIVIFIASVVGISSAYFGGMVDEFLMRYVDIQITFPAFFLYLLLVYLFGGSLFLMILIFGFTGWGGIARIVRSEALQRREEAYVRAAKSAGASSVWTMRRHLLPNVSNSVITAATLLIPSFILFEAALSFLALGDPTIPSWGQVIADGRTDIATAWWISTIPGFFLFFTILAFNFLGDALRDSLDPRQEVR